MNQEKCNVCQGTLRVNVKNNGYLYYRCDKCYTSQIIPQPSEDELYNFYKGFHLRDYQGGAYDWIEERMRLDFNSKINILKKYKGVRGNKLLDVGCGKGYFVKECNESDFDAKGIDISKPGIELANKLNLNVNLGRIEDFSLQPDYKESFDFVTLLATIEHLPDPLRTLQAIKHCLKPGGILLLDTGLGNDKFENFLVGHSQWFDAPQHLFVFSEEGLKFLLKKCGFNIIHIVRNYDRTLTRRLIRWIRHTAISLLSFVFLRPIVGKNSSQIMKIESKWPIGKLIQVVAQKK